MWCSISIPVGFLALTERYSSSPRTDLYMAGKSMTGTVRVPSISKTTPLRRALRVKATELTMVEVAINEKGDFGWTKQAALETRKCMAWVSLFLGFYHSSDR